MFRGSWNSNKGLKDGIIGAIIRQNVLLISAKQNGISKFYIFGENDFFKFPGV